jgi:hypothetical protein
MQPILWTERPTGALVVGAGSLWPKLWNGIFFNTFSTPGRQEVLILGMLMELFIPVRYWSYVQAAFCLVYVSYKPGIGSGIRLQNQAHHVWKMVVYVVEKVENFLSTNY